MPVGITDTLSQDSIVMQSSHAVEVIIPIVTIQSLSIQNSVQSISHEMIHI